MAETGPANNAQLTDKNSTPRSARPALLRPPIMVALIVVVIVIAVVGGRYWAFEVTHASTDDAYLADDVVQISPQVSGTVEQVRVSENHKVNAGDLLVVLDDATYRSAVAQKQADFNAAVAQAKGAGVNVALTAQSGSAQVQQATGAVEQAKSGVGGAVADVKRAEAGVRSAAAAAQSAEASIRTAEAGLSAAVANKQRAASSVGAAQAQLDAARAGVKAARSVADRAARDAQRYAELAKKGAISQETLDQAMGAAETSSAMLESAQAVVLQKDADLSAARDQLNASDAAIAQARAQLSATREQSLAARANVAQAEAQRDASRQMVGQAQARSHQALGQLTQARTAPHQVAMSRSAQAQSLAKIEQARAALDAARLQLSYTRIYAPVAGRISKKTIEVGALVQPGMPLMALVKTESPWVVANYKETQLRGLVPGCAAEVRVDAVPGRVFRGHVDSISAATGATFALLPPDNATGNFTKVVQRVPVKIVLEPDQPDSDRLRAGMSVLAVVSTK